MKTKTILKPPVIIDYKENEFSLIYEKCGNPDKGIFPDQVNLFPPLKFNIKAKWVISHGSINLITGLRETSRPGFYIGDILDTSSGKKKRSILIARLFEREKVRYITILFYPNRNPKNKREFLKNEIIKFKRGFYD